MFCIFFIFSPDDFKMNCWHVFTGTFADRFLGRVLYNSGKCGLEKTAVRAFHFSVIIEKRNTATALKMSPQLGF